MNRLPLHHDLYVLAHDQAGRPLIHQSSLALGLAGAALLDRLPAGSDPPPEARSLIKQVAANAVYERTRRGLLDTGVLVGVRGRRMGMLPYTRYELADIASAVRASSGVRSAVEGWKPADARSAGLCGLVAVLRLEAELYLDEPAARLVSRLRQIAATAGPPIGGLVAIVETLIAEAAVAVYR
ncbi:GPP34 family phosphoprotein [Nonomuraea sp. MG754425]|uniref:GOLPH3/VPS74 family protein n=1 Tax=Nonomuraea sp. MG754425 TaxID=2570319 RepID=UPI001F3DD698|nr:GPP34 family phosphoprotein [Nonomuraea sp. MG754425]MCF6472331.1 GPP34 family phosphoprotein [Nonomuraea sp. MG754425]